VRAPLTTDLDRARRVLPSLPGLLRAPEARARLRHELRATGIALALALVVGMWLMPMAAEHLADLLFPADESVNRGRFFGKKKTVVAHPLRDPFYVLVVALGWTLGALVTIRLFLRAGDRALGSTGERESSVEATLVSGARTMVVGARSIVEVSKGALKGALRGAGFDESTDAGTRYALRGELGRGGMGIVHLAEDTVLGREVALKELPAHLMGSKELYERFRVEARALARLSHPGIVQVFDLVQGPSGSFMAMELVRGGSLDDKLVEGTPMSVGEVARLGAALARALEHAHASGVIHRDFKPQNVLITETGDPKVTDFGLAKMQEGPKLTQAGAMMGSPAYMSPEQATGGATDGKTDVYSLGVTLFQMAAGRLPFEESGPALFMAHLQAEPPRLETLNPEVPVELANLVAAMLAKAPSDRPELARVADVLDALGAVAASGVELDAR
jgi:eukaryotic-like serine/threonine-protein kinase